MHKRPVVLGTIQLPRARRAVGQAMPRLGRNSNLASLRPEGKIMALVSRLSLAVLKTEGKHLPVDCTYSVIKLETGLHLQLDTYGSKTRKVPGKKSQSLRLSPEALTTLKKIIADFKL
jgi:hypothetical protein